MSVRTPRFRSVLDSFTPYRPGRQPTATATGGRSFKLSSNESPYGPLPSVVERHRRGGRRAQPVPRPRVRRADRTRSRPGSACPAAHVAVGCGSVGLTQQLLAATAEPGAEVLYAWRSFEAYPHLTDLAGATSVRVPLRDQAHDLAAMADAITDRTRLIFVCNPEQPDRHRGRTPPSWTWFLDQVPPDCLVVLDEAYHEYVRDPDVPDGAHPLPRPAQRGRAAHLLQGLRAGRAAGRVPDRARAGRRGRAQDACCRSP